MALNNLEEDRAASRTEAVADLVQFGEVAGVEDFALDDGEVDFCLVQPGATTTTTNRSSSPAPHRHLPRRPRHRLRPLPERPTAWARNPTNLRARPLSRQVGPGAWSPWPSCGRWNTACRQRGSAACGYGLSAITSASWSRDSTTTPGRTSRQRPISCSRVSASLPVSVCVVVKTTFPLWM